MKRIFVVLKWILRLKAVLIWRVAGKHIDWCTFLKSGAVTVADICKIERKCIGETIYGVLGFLEACMDPAAM